MFAVQPSSTWAIYADNPTSTPPANLGGLAYNFKQYNQSLETDQKSNPILGSGNGLFLANSSTLAVNLVPTAQIGKVYDGNVTANLVESSYNITGILAGDLLNINKPAIGAYDNKNAGTGRLVSVSALTITSVTETATDVPGYGYSLPSSNAFAAIGSITPKELLVTGLVANNKIYDATVVAQLGGNAAVSPIGADEVIVAGTEAGAFGDKNVGSDKAVTVKGVTISGKDAGNYNLLQQSGLKATISKASQSLSGLVADNKVYDATTAAQLSGSSVVNPIAADEVAVTGKAVGTFANKNVAQAKAVSVSGGQINCRCVALEFQLNRRTTASANPEQLNGSTRGSIMRARS